MKFKRVIASILAICMVLSTMSFNVFAEETETGSVTESGSALTISGTLATMYVQQSGERARILGDVSNVNAAESIVIKLYCDDTLLGTTSLNSEKHTFPYTADSLTVNMVMAGEPSGSWNTVWEDGMPNVNKMPNRAELYIDNQMLSEASVLLNGPDDSAKVVAAVTDADGKILSVVANAEKDFGSDFNAVLQEAINAGGNIVLLRDVALTGALTIPADATVALDLNGKTLTYSTDVAGEAMITNKGELTLKGNGNVAYSYTGTVDGGKAANAIRNEGNLIIDGPAVTNTTTANGQIGYAMDNYAGAVLTINSGSLTVSGSVYYDAIRMFCNSETADNTVVINGGTVGTVWMQNPSDGSDARNTKDTVLGNLTITGGTVGTVYLEPCAAFEASITGGTIAGVQANDTANSTSTAVPTGIITGGTFTSDVSAFVADGFEYDSETGEVVTESAPVATVNGVGYKTLAEAFTAADAGDEIVINQAGTYTVPTGKDVTITGDVNGVKFDMSNAVGVYSSMTFNNVTFEYSSNANYIGLQHAGTMEYNNCTFNGQVFLYGTSETFNNCTFNQTSKDAYNVWTYGAKNVKFNECTLNSAGKSVLVYNEGACATELTVVDTDFNASQTVDGKAAIEIDTSLMPSGTEIVVDAATTAEGFSENTKSGSSLWHDKKVDSTAANGGTTSVVIVAGETVKDTVENAPKGTNSPAYTKEVDGYVRVWGQSENTNAAESYVLKLYSNDTLIATTVLNNVGNIIDGSQDSVTWNFYYPTSNDEYWTTTWEEGHPNSAAQPTKVELYIDGTLVDTTEVQMNGADSLNPVVWAELGGVEYIVTGLSGTGSIEDPYLINNLAELKWFRDAVNAGDNYAGKTVTLADDIDLSTDKDDEGNQISWTPIGTSSTPFNGTFDGNGKTISNLLITGNNSDVGLFGRTNSGAVKNLTINNAKVSGYLNVGALAGTPYTSDYSNIKLTGHVEINGFAYVGGVGGKNAYADWTDITVDVDETSYVNANSVSSDGTAYRTYVGGVIGFMGEGSQNLTNISSNIKVTGSTCDVGGIVGIAHYGNTLTNVSCSGAVEITNSDDLSGAKEIGGIAGVWHNGGTVTFEDCTFTGTISSTYTNEDGETVTLTENDFANGGLIGSAYSASGTGEMIIDYEAYIGTTVYETLAEALAAVQADDTLTLLADITTADTINVTGNLTIDGNGHTLTYTGQSRAITVGTGVDVDLTVKNLTVDCTAGYCERGINYNTNGKLTLEGVTVKGTSVTYAVNLPSSSDNAIVMIANSDITGHIALNVWGENSVITVTDTDLTSVDTTEVENYSAVKLNNNGSISAEGATVTISGGSITALDEKGEPSYAVSNSTATGTVTVSETTEVIGIWSDPVAVVLYEGYDQLYGCVTLQAAINRAANDSNATVKLLKDITLTESLTVDGSVVIDLNGKTITSSNNRVIKINTVSNGAESVTIKNGTIISTANGGRCIQLAGSALKELTIDTVTLTAINGATQPITLSEQNSEELLKVTVKDSTFTASNNGYAMIAFCPIDATIENSNLSGFAALYFKGDYDNTGVYSSKNSKVAVTNSTLNGTNVQNGANSFTVINFEADNIEVTVTGGSVNVVAEGDAEEAVTGGKGVSNINLTLDTELNVGENCLFFLFGDIKQHNISVRDDYADELAALGYAFENSETEGMITVTGNAVAKIGDKTYATLADAFAAAKSGDVIDLLDDISVTDQIKVKDNSVLSDITLNGNGHTITADLDQNGESVLYFGDTSTSAWATGVEINDLTITGTARFAIALMGGTSSVLNNVKVEGDYIYGINLYGTHGAEMTDCDIVTMFTNAQDDNPLNLVNTHIGTLYANKSDVDSDKGKITIGEGSAVDKLIFWGDNTKMIASGLDKITTIEDSEGNTLVAEVGGVGYTNLASAIADVEKKDTLTLLADIDLEGVAWTPAEFVGATFEGNNKTIKNLTVTGTNNVGLFSKISDATINNLTLENVTSTGIDSVGTLAGYLANSTVTNVNVKGTIKVNSNYKAGGMVGASYGSYYNCSVDGTDKTISYVKATHDGGSNEGDNVGGMIGHRGEGAGVMDGCSVKNITVEGTRKIGGMVGSAFQDNIYTNNTVDNVIVATNATVDYATNNQKTFGLGGLVGLYTANGNNDGKVENAAVNNVEFVVDEAIADLVTTGVITGGLRGTTVPTETAATMTYAGNTATNVTGADNTYLIEEEEPEVEVEVLSRVRYYIDYMPIVSYPANVTLYRLGLYSAADSTDYKEYGFEITVDGQNPVMIKANRYNDVLNIIVGGEKETYTASQFNRDGGNNVCIFGQTISFTADALGDGKISYRPYVVTKDGVTKWGYESTAPNIYTK